MTDAPIYDQLVEDNHVKEVLDGFYERVLRSGLTFLAEEGALRRWGKDTDFIYEFQVQQLKSRRFDYGYHYGFKKKYGRNVYRSVVDWKV